MAEHLQKKHWGEIKVMVRAAGALSDSTKSTKIDEKSGQITKHTKTHEKKKKTHEKWSGVAM